MSGTTGLTLTKDELISIVFILINKAGGKVRLEPSDEAPAGSLFIYKDNDNNYVMEIENDSDNS